MTRRLPIRLATACSLLALASAATAVPGLPSCTLGELARRAGIHVGAAFVEGRDDPAFRATLVRQFSSVTAPLYWAETQPAPGTYDFSVADTAVALAEANGMRIRGHPLVWGRLALPDYVQHVTTADALRAMMADRIGTVVRRYAGRIAQYDVVNEPLTVFGAPGTTGGFDDNVFYRLLGVDYIREALELAHAADPNARLFINDFFAERPGAKQDRLFALAQSLVDAGAPLDGIGLQGHIHLPVLFGYEPSAADVEAAVRRFASLGLAVEITELDVTLSSRDDCQLDFQRRFYHGIVSACLAVPACSGVTTWGITDQFTWIKDFFGVDGAPLLFDEAYAPKPAYFGVRDALVEHACGARDACSPECAPDTCTVAGGCPSERAAGCCDADTDCPDEPCTTGRSCADHACTGGTAVVCDDGDPCTVDSCGPGGDCRPDPVYGFEAAACVCTRPAPAACGATLPATAGERFARACSLIAAAREADATRAARLLVRAGEQLRRARRLLVEAAHAGAVSRACARAAGASLQDALHRIRRVRLA